MEESLSGDEQVFILEVKKVACIVEDKDREDDPAEKGFDGWCKWEETDFDK